jgi:hypothetical protein
MLGALRCVQSPFEPRVKTRGYRRKSSDDSCPGFQPPGFRRLSIRQAVTAYIFFNYPGLQPGGQGTRQFTMNRKGATRRLSCSIILNFSIFSGSSSPELFRLLINVPRPYRLQPHSFRSTIVRKAVTSYILFNCPGLQPGGQGAGQDPINAQRRHPAPLCMDSLTCWDQRISTSSRSKFRVMPAIGWLASRVTVVSLRSTISTTACSPSASPT